MELGARAALNISWEGPRQTQSGHVAADLTISEGDIEVKYDVYLRNAIARQFVSTDRGRAELAARLLRLAGISTEAERIGGGGRYAELADAIARWLEETSRQ